MAIWMELILLALAAYAAGLGMGAVAANLWSLRADAFRVNARERKHQDNR